MDEQHRKWFGILNRLHDAMLNGKGRDVQQSVMAEMVAYTRTHFLQEELLLKTKGFPRFAEHREKHTSFTKQVQALEAKMLGGSALLTIDVMNFLKNWLKDHILAEDARYGTF
jgi:hemerythrin